MTPRMTRARAQEALERLEILLEAWDAADNAWMDHAYRNEDAYGAYVDQLLLDARRKASMAIDLFLREIGVDGRDYPENTADRAREALRVVVGGWEHTVTPPFRYRTTEILRGWGYPDVP